jgi:TetR/AcrR family transcriptional regulator, transcriptional repressor for nem operon
VSGGDRYSTPGLPTKRRGPGSRADDAHPTRHELLDAALVVGETGGLSALTVAAVIEQASVARGTFYIHFDDRAEMLIALHDRFHSRLFAAIATDTAEVRRGPARTEARLIAFLEHCVAQPGIRTLLRDAGAEQAIAALSVARRIEAAKLLEQDLPKTPYRTETAQLLVAAATQVASAELARGQRLPKQRSALLQLALGNR